MKLYVGNLPYTATEDDIHSHFTEAGIAPGRVELVIDRDTNKSKGFAFATVSDEDGSRAIDNLNGIPLGGRKLVVNEARPKPERAGAYSGPRNRDPRGFRDRR